MIDKERHPLLIISRVLFDPVKYWRPPSLSELTPIIFNTGLTHLASEASISHFINAFKTGSDVIARKNIKSLHKEQLA